MRVSLFIVGLHRTTLQQLGITSGARGQTQTLFIHAGFGLPAFGKYPNEYPKTMAWRPCYGPSPATVATIIRTPPARYRSSAISRPQRPLGQERMSYGPEGWNTTLPLMVWVWVCDPPPTGEIWKTLDTLDTAGGRRAPRAPQGPAGTRLSMVVPVVTHPFSWPSAAPHTHGTARQPRRAAPGIEAPMGVWAGRQPNHGIGVIARDQTRIDSAGSRRPIPYRPLS